MPHHSRRALPETQDLLRLTVLATRRLSEHWMRVTLGGGDIARFTPMGFDQWFRLFLPVHGGDGLERVPAKANKMLGYLKLLRIPEGQRPVMRSYTVRAFRELGESGGAEIDVDFVIHRAPDGGLGPAPAWALAAEPGEDVALIDEGTGFNPRRTPERVLLVGDETALPAIAGICASLPGGTRGSALIEVPAQEDAQDLARPEGLEVRWIVRNDPHEVPGRAAAEALASTELPEGDGPFYAFIAGEQQLPTGARRHLVAERGVDKDDIGFCGYWRVGRDRRG
jgi:NADPH-dependent ferric siderophore reductase